MPLDAAQGSEIKGLISAARKGPVNFGFCVAAKPENDALVLHRNKTPDSLGREAKAQAKATKVACGSLVVEGSVASLTVEDAPPSGVAKRARGLLKLLNLNMSVRIVGKDGQVFDEEGGGEDVPQDPSQAKQEEPDLGQTEWLSLRDTLERDVGTFLSRGMGDVGRVRSAWAMTTEAAAQGDYPAAIKMGRRLAQSMVETGGATADTAQGRWVVAERDMGPRVELALSKQVGPCDKIRAVWSFAQGKAESGNFEAALKSLVPLEGLLQDAGSATKSQAAAAIKPGTVRRRGAELRTAADLTGELAALAPRLKIAETLLPPARVKDIGVLVSEVQSAASTNDLDMARVSLTKLDILLGEADRAAPEKAKWEEARDKIDPRVTEALTNRGGDVGKIRAVWDFALGKAEVADFKAALASLAPLDELLKAAGAEKAKWEQARDEMAPRVKSVLEKGRGDVTKIRAVWGFALGKEEAAAFPAALSALTPLDELVKAAESATKSEAETATTAGTVVKARYEAEVEALKTKLAAARKIGGFNDTLSRMALELRQLQTAVQQEVAKPDYALALQAHALLAAKVNEISGTKVKYDADKLIWQQKLAAGAATIETVEGCGAVTTKIDALKQPFDAALLRARAAAKDRNFDVAARELDAALGHAKTYLDAKIIADTGMAQAFGEARKQGAKGLAAIPPVVAAGGGAVEGVASAMETNGDLAKSEGLQKLLAEAKLIEKLYGTSSAESLCGNTDTVDSVISAAERAIINCQAYQNGHKSKGKTDQAKSAQAEALVVRYREMVTGLRGLKTTFGDIDAGLTGDIAAKGKALGLLQAMTAPPAPEILREGAQQRMREATVALMKAATCPDQLREVAELVGGDLKAQYDRQMAAGKLAQTANGSTKAAAHASTKVLNAKRAENVDQSKLLAGRLIGPDGQLEVTGLFACDPDGLADKTPAKKHMARTLKNLRDDPEAWAALESIPAPKPGSTGEKMIRATLGLGPDAKIGPADARKAALSALLTDLRQQDVGSCFATQVAIRVHDTQPTSFLKDMAALMKTGAIERTFNGNTIQIPLEGEMSDKALETSTVKLRKGPQPQIKGSSSGGDLPSPAVLEDSPAFAAVLDQLQIADGRGTAINSAITRMQDSDEFKLNQNRKALKAAAAAITDKNERNAVLAAALLQVTADPESVQTALAQAMTDQAVDPAQQTSATQAAAGKLSALDYDVEPGMIVRQLVMGKVGLDEDDFKNLEEFRAKTAQVKADPKMSRLDENGRLAPLVSPADDDLKKLLADLEKLDKKIDRNKMQAYEAAKQGCYDAFLGDEDNRLLRAWEYTVSALAEAGSMKSATGSWHDANKEAMTDELNDVYNDMESDPEFKKAKVKKPDFEKYAVQLLDEYQRLYDEVVKSGYDASVSTEDSADGSSSRGAHYLYDSQGASSPLDWIKIDDKSKYQVLVRGLVMLAWANLFSKDKSKPKVKITRDLADKMADKLGSEGFIAAAKQKVETATGQSAADPWELPGGSDELDVIQGYDEREATVQDLGSAPNAEGLMKSLTGHLKGLWTAPRSRLKAETNADPENAGLTAGLAGVHTFKVSTGDPKLKALLESGLSVDQAIAAFKLAETTKWQAAATATPATDPEDVRAFCVQIWGTRVSNATVNAVSTRAAALASPNPPNHDHLARAAKEVLEARGLTPENSAGFVAKATFASVVPPIAAAELPAKLEAVAKSLDVPDDLIPAVTKRAATALAGDDPADVKTIRTAIQAAMTEEGLDLQADRERCLAALRERPGVVIGDSNWGDSEHHTKYAMVVNPSSGEMEMWRMNEDGSNPSKMDQDKWAKGKWNTVV